MISLSALVKPKDGIHSVRLLEKSLREHYENVPVKDHQYLVRFADGPALVTDELAGLRVDVVVSDERAATHFREALAGEIATRVLGRTVDVVWSRSATVPAPLR